MTEMTTSNLQSKKEDLVLLITAAGSSTRMGKDSKGKSIKKEYLPLEKGTVLSCAAKAFLTSLDFSLVLVTYSPLNNSISSETDGNLKLCKEALFKDKEVSQCKAEFLFVAGGKTRQESVFNALKAAEEYFSKKSSDSDPIVFIHDGARPFIKGDTIKLAYQAAREFGASVPGLQPVDTQKEIDSQGFIVRHLVRKNICAVQTPQVFRLFPLVKAHHKAADKALKESVEFTDDTEIWDTFADLEQYSRVKVVAGDPGNKKITYREDIL